MQGRTENTSSSRSSCGLCFLPFRMESWKVTLRWTFLSLNNLCLVLVPVAAATFPVSCSTAAFATLAVVVPLSSPVSQADCYVSLWLPTATCERSRTKTVRNSDNPVWNETFYFRIQSQVKVRSQFSAWSRLKILCMYLLNCAQELSKRWHTIKSCWKHLRKRWQNSCVCSMVLHRRARKQAQFWSFREMRDSYESVQDGYRIWELPKLLYRYSQYILWQQLKWTRQEWICSSSMFC